MRSDLEILFDQSERSYIGTQGGDYLVEYCFELAGWDLESKRRLYHYWRESRWFELKSTPSQLHFYGTRGHLLGNLFSFDIRKLRSELLVEVEGSRINSRVRLDFSHQQMSEWDMLFLKLEHVLFRDACRGLSNEVLLQRLKAARRPAQFGWVLSGGRRMESLPAEIVSEIVRLSGGNLPRVKRVFV